MHIALTQSPTAVWASVFLGEGFDPLDGANRVRLLGRAQGAVFASIAVRGQPVAAGAACISSGWAGVHGMRTAPSQRGRGLARRILGALAQQALARGITQAFLQVEEANEGAQSLYRRTGFAPGWTYAYWRRAAM